MSIALTQRGSTSVTTTPAKPATPAAPSTPASQTQQVATPNGAWRHPKFDEITKRQYATTFDERNVSTIFGNVVALLVSFLAVPMLGRIAVLRNWVIGPCDKVVQTIPYHSWIILSTRLIFLANIVQALLPLARRWYPDDISDIPLTPSQRQAMGLDPNVSTPQTPGSGFASPLFVTPPRYQMSTPRSSFGTPAGERLSPSPGRSLSGSPRATSNSPFSPSSGSPLFQKAIGGGSATRRGSYDNRNSPLGSSLFGDSSASNTPGTPTPGMGKASVGLNNKWLYEKRRDSPRSSLFA
ncbi:nuclear pore complex component-domain-containing protein [Lophiotrema nucula]|uniref:Nuclear pore complex component-domain-containing protein n=1 Tax=Lophiotrema nucula TaxID=690887 RepID=A0A6A5Z333_9PLEO|nr:nuclear pore complex component-domain-containing protein [Lophiotrema nucula]